MKASSRSAKSSSRRQSAADDARTTLSLPRGFAYDIITGAGVLEPAVQEYFRTHAAGPKAFILADACLPEAEQRLRRALEAAGRTVETFFVEVSEAFKSVESLYPLYGQLLKAGADRQSTLFALGGGVIGDAGGFLAATFMRGLAWVGVPTTLLAQVDSSIGGKTGVNHAAGKNLVGTLYQPSLVICDTDLLATLPARDLVSGLGEIVKYGLIYDAKFFTFVAQNWERMAAGDPAVLGPAIRACARFKARVVEKDEHDTTGIREVLNFGHTVGHAIEAAGEYGRFRHGEAVVLGMRAETAISVAKGHLDARTGARIESVLAAFPVPPLPPEIPDDKILPYVKFDKKSEAGRVRFVLLRGLGRTVSDKTVTEAEIRASLAALRK